MAVMTATTTFTSGDVMLIGTDISLAPFRGERPETWHRLLAGRNVLEMPVRDTSYAATAKALIRSDQALAGWDLAYAGGTAGMAAATFAYWQRQQECEADHTEADAWYLDYTGCFQGTRHSSRVATTPSFIDVGELIKLHDRKDFAKYADPPAARCEGPDADRVVLPATTNAPNLRYLVVQQLQLEGAAVLPSPVGLLDLKDGKLRLSGITKYVTRPRPPYPVDSGKRTLLHMIERAHQLGGDHAEVVLLHPGTKRDCNEIATNVQDLIMLSQTTRFEVRPLTQRWIDP